MIFGDAPYTFYFLAGSILYNKDAEFSVVDTRSRTSMRCDLALRPERSNVITELRWCHNFLFQGSYVPTGQLECVEVITDHTPVNKNHDAIAPTTWTLFIRNATTAVDLHAAVEMVVLLRGLFAARARKSVPSLELNLRTSSALIFCIGALIQEIPMPPKCKETVLSFSSESRIC